VFLAAAWSSDFFQIGILPAIFLKKRFKNVPANQTAAQRNNTEKNIPTQEEPPASLKDFFNGLGVTLKFSPFLKLCAATFLVFTALCSCRHFNAMSLSTVASLAINHSGRSTQAGLEPLLLYQRFV